MILSQTPAAPNITAPLEANVAVSRFATAKGAALLAYLALHPRRAYAREELIALFWPDAEWEQGQASLRSALAALRRQLEPPGTPPQSLLIASRQTVRLNPDAFSTDAADFDAAFRRGDSARCHTLYGGDLLPGVYADWAIALRERFVALRERLPTNSGGTSADAPSPLPSVPAAKSDAPTTAPTSRLPITLSRCFGREADITRLSELLVGTGKTPPRRLLTLTGPGGIGKTRLALEAARGRLAPAFGQAVFWANLADLTEARHIAGRIAHEALALPPAAIPDAAEPWERIIETLASYPAALLVLDNLEQLLQSSETAGRIALLLRRAPHLSLLATSRRRLLVEGEWEYPVAPLALPDPSLFGAAEEMEASETASGETIEAAANSAAIQLFVDRAQAARPDFALTPRNAHALVELCRRLEGLPLALELVAARAPTLTPAQMQKGLSAERGLHQFADTRGRHPARHHSVGDAIAWSVRLLPPPLREFWTALSVFRGGFTGDAVRQVTDVENADESLTQLRERSLLTLREAPDGESLRFGFLETLREFADESLDEARRAPLAAAHAAYFADFAETVLPALMQKHVGRHLDALEAERSNFHAALAYCEADGSEAAAQTGLRLCAALWRFWEMRGPFREGRDYLAAFLGVSAATTEARANALNGAGMLAARQGDYAAARAYHEECLQTYRALNHRKGEAVALGNLGLLSAEQNRYEEARALYGESLAIRREIDDTFGIALMLNNLGNVLSETGDHALADEYLTESLRLHRERDDRTGVAQALGNLGNARYRAGNADEAIRLHEEGLAILTAINDKRGVASALLNLSEMSQGRGDATKACDHLRACLPLLRELGDRRMLAYALDSVAGLAHARRDDEAAALLYGAGERLRESAGIHIPPVQRAAHDAALAAIESAIGAAAYRAAFDRGGQLREGAAKNALAVLSQNP